MKIKLFTLILLFTLSISNAENLYQPDSFKSLVADRKATRVGDLITLLIVESSQAESRAGTGTDKRLDVGLDAFDNTRAPSLGLDFSRGSDSQARTVRKGLLQAQIAVTVKHITTNGNYVVEGLQTLNINNEEQVISLKGMLRPEDISRDNIAFSNRLANADIQFTGEGIVGDEQKHGIIQTILGWLGII